MREAPGISAPLSGNLFACFAITQSPSQRPHFATSSVGQPNAYFRETTKEAWGMKKTFKTAVIAVLLAIWSFPAVSLAAPPPPARRLPRSRSRPRPPREQARSAERSDGAGAARAADAGPAGLQGWRRLHLLRQRRRAGAAHHPDRHPDLKHVARDAAVRGRARRRRARLLHGLGAHRIVGPRRRAVARSVVARRARRAVRRPALRPRLRPGRAGDGARALRRHARGARHLRGAGARQRTRRRSARRRARPRRARVSSCRRRSPI